MEALLLDLDGIVFKMIIKGWAKGDCNKDKWCKVDIQISSKFIYYTIKEQEILTCGDVEELRNTIAQMLLGKCREKTEIEFDEPDLEFCLYPANENISDITGEIRVAFWNQGALSANSFHLALGQADLIYISQYLSYVMEEGEKERLEIMRKTGSLVSPDYAGDPINNVSIDIDKLKMTTRLKNILHRNDIYDLRELEHISEPDILRFRNMGVSTMQELKELCDLNNIHIHTRLELQDEKAGIWFEDSDYSYLFKMGIRCNADLASVPQEVMEEIKDKHKTMYRKLVALKNNMKI